MTKGSVQYHLDKVKGGRCGSSAGKPRPYARQNMLTARLYSPKLIGQSVTVTPKESFSVFRVGHYYEWRVVDEGVGFIQGIELDADDIKQNFIVKRRQDGKGLHNRYQ